MNYLICSTAITQTPEGVPLCSGGWSSKTEEQVITELGIGPMPVEDFQQLSSEIIMLFVIAAGIKLVKSQFTQPVRG